ncbi:MAG: type II toxin-antitoxin system RelE/ParE family toxin [Magnetococcales bacterium]|nr:type II toxin-antitoxin system RelE/ParE family toxin [Magnetococcales bacterium]
MNKLKSPYDKPTWENMRTKRKYKRFSKDGAILNVKWTVRALKSLFESTEYIRSENPVKVREVVTEIQNVVENLKRFPSLGIATRFKNTRDLVHPKYDFLIRYRLVGKDLIEIVIVLHTARNYR